MSKLPGVNLSNLKNGPEDVYGNSGDLKVPPFGIRVNQITPGHYPTRLTSGIAPDVEATLKAQIPLRRFGHTREIGAAAVLLLSDRLSSYTTGSDIVVDGGLSLRPISLYTDEEIRKMNARVEEL